MASNRARMPAEWEPQQALWLAFPYSEEAWPGRLAQAREAWLSLVAAASRYQTVRILSPKDLRADLYAHLAIAGVSMENIDVVDAQYDDVWLRDSGPVVLESNGEARWLDTLFNGWGQKYPHEQDSQLCRELAKRLGIHRNEASCVTEGGALESNGHGIVLSTASALLNENRNPGRTREDLIQALKTDLGADSLVLLEAGLGEDHTDGHIDNVARFVREDRLLVSTAPSTDHPDAAALDAARKALNGFAECIDLPLPEPIEHAGKRLPASYTNYICLNGAILLPTFGQGKADRRALTTLGECFPDREIVGLDCREILTEGGAWHCLSFNEFAVGS